MTPAARLWREERIVEWSARAAHRRQAGRRVDTAIADCLDSICARLRAEMAAAPPPAEAAPAPAKPAFDFATLFTAPASVRHRHSAEVCRRIGEPAAAAAFERLAEQCEAEDQGAPPIAAIVNRPPPDPVPFTMGPQMDLL